MEVMRRLCAGPVWSGRQVLLLLLPLYGRRVDAAAGEGQAPSPVSNTCSTRLCFRF